MSMTPQVNVNCTDSLKNFFKYIFCCNGCSCGNSTTVHGGSSTPATVPTTIPLFNVNLSGNNSGTSDLEGRAKPVTDLSSTSQSVSKTGALSDENFLEGASTIVEVGGRVLRKGFGNDF